MSITKTSRNPDAFANGFDYFCVNCGYFFSAQIADTLGNKGEVSFCPRCGEDILAERTLDLIDHCITNHADTVNFYSAFPPDKPLPHSRTGATPKQVEWIIGCATSSTPATIESLAAELGYDKKIVEAVLDELHITLPSERKKPPQ
jgi:DNA-directed RNA polymerase subunit RPC12/RpoP